MKETLILIAEDDADCSIIIDHTFENLYKNYRWEVLPDGPSFLNRVKLLQQEDILPDILLIDITLPGMDGFEVIKEIKKEPLLINIPIVVFSGSYSPTDMAKAYLAGADWYTCKPVSFNDFGRYLEAAVQIGLSIKEDKQQLLLDTFNKVSSHHLSSIGE